jgi:hypothetical protein
MSDRYVTRRLTAEYIARHDDVQRGGSEGMRQPLAPRRGGRRCVSVEEVRA